MAVTKMERFCKLIRARLRNKKDAVCSVEGEEGDGKTTFSILASKNVSKNFKINYEYVHIAPTIEQLFHAVKYSDRFSSFVGDEIIDLLYKLNWNSRATRKINKLFTKCRRENKCWFLCIPRHIDLVEFFRNHRVMFRIHIPYRGIAIVYKKDTTKDVEDPWHIKENRKIMKKILRGKLKHEVTKGHYLKALRQQKGYLMEMEFPALSEKDQEQYDTMANEGKYDNFLDDTRTDGEVALANSILFILKNNPEITQVQIAKELDIHKQKVYRIVKRLKEEGKYEPNNK